jgi:hypothetical protein
MQTRPNFQKNLFNSVTKTQKKLQIYEENEQCIKNNTQACQNDYEMMTSF